MNHLLIIAKIVKFNHLILHAKTQTVKFNYMYFDCIKLVEKLKFLLNNLIVTVYDDSLRRA